MNTDALSKHKVVKYFGSHQEIGGCTIWATVEGIKSDPWNEAVRHIEKHSPDGMQWGYGGSGPADAALSILTHFCRHSQKWGTDSSLPERLYQDFKWQFIAPITGDLEISAEDIEAWLQKKA